MADEAWLVQCTAEQSEGEDHSDALAVKLLDILQGKWLGHPLHPAVVHVPLALWIVAAVCDVLIVRDVAVLILTRLSLYCVGVGLLGALIAVPTGIAEWVPIKKTKPAWRLALYHLLLNVGAIGLFVVNFIFRLREFRHGDGMSHTVVITSVLGAVLLIASGYIGSLMAYDHGISVARLSKKKWRAVAARGGSRLPEEK